MKNKGFTLVELMVTVSIIGLLSVVVFANYRAGEKQFALQRSAHQLAQDIRRVQNMAMATAECPGGTGCAGIVPSGYGIILRRPADWKYKYRLYADIDGDNAFSDSNDTVIELIDLEKGVFIKAIRRPSPPNPNFTWGCINFKPPDPIVNISLRDPDAYSAQLWTKITLALESDDTKIKTVKINAVGLIEIE